MALTKKQQARQQLLNQLNKKNNGGVNAKKDAPNYNVKLPKKVKSPSRRSQGFSELNKKNTGGTSSVPYVKPKIKKKEESKKTLPSLTTKDLPSAFVFNSFTNNAKQTPVNYRTIKRQKQSDFINRYNNRAFSNLKDNPFLNNRTMFGLPTNNPTQSLAGTLAAANQVHFINDRGAQDWINKWAKQKVYGSKEAVIDEIPSYRQDIKEFLDTNTLVAAMLSGEYTTVDSQEDVDRINAWLSESMVSVKRFNPDTGKVETITKPVKNAPMFPIDSNLDEATKKKLRAAWAMFVNYQDEDLAQATRIYKEEQDAKKRTAGTDKNATDSLLDVFRDTVNHKPTRVSDKDTVLGTSLNMLSMSVEKTAFFMQDSINYFRNYIINPLKHQEYGKAMWNTLINLGETLDLIAIAPRAYFAATDYIWGTTEYIEGKDAFIYSGGKSKQQALIDAGLMDALRLDNGNARDGVDYLARIKSAGLYKEYLKFKKEWQANKRGVTLSDRLEKISQAYTDKGSNFDFKSDSALFDLLGYTVTDPSLMIGGLAKVAGKAAAKQLARTATKETAEAIKLDGDSLVNAVSNQIANRFSRGLYDFGVNDKAYREAAESYVKDLVRTGNFDGTRAQAFEDTLVEKLYNARAGIKGRLISSMHQIDTGFNKFDSFLLKNSFGSVYYPYKAAAVHYNKLRTSEAVEEFATTRAQKQRAKVVDIFEDKYEDRSVAKYPEFMENMKKSLSSADPDSDEAIKIATRLLITDTAEWSFKAKGFIRDLRQSILKNTTGNAEQITQKAIEDFYKSINPNISTVSEFKAFIDDIEVRYSDDFPELVEHFTTSYRNLLKDVDDALVYARHMDSTTEFKEVFGSAFNDTKDPANIKPFYKDDDVVFDTIVDDRGAFRLTVTFDRIQNKLNALVKDVLDKDVLANNKSLNNLLGFVDNHKNFKNVNIEELHGLMQDAMYDLANAKSLYERYKGLKDVELIGKYRGTATLYDSIYEDLRASDVYLLNDRWSIETDDVELQLYRVRGDIFDVFQNIRSNTNINEVINNIRSTKRGTLGWLVNKATIDKSAVLDSLTGDYSILREPLSDVFDTLLDIKHTVDNIDLYDNFTASLEDKVLALNDAQKLSIMDTVFGFSSYDLEKFIKNEYSVNPMIDSINLSLDSVTGTAKLSLDVFRKVATNFNHEMYNNYPEIRNNPKIQLKINKILNADGHIDPRNDVKVQMLQVILRSPDVASTYNKLAAEKPVIFTDIETTSLHPSSGEIFSIACIPWRVFSEEEGKININEALDYLLADIKETNSGQFSRTFSYDEIYGKDGISQIMSNEKLRVFYADDVAAGKDYNFLRKRFYNRYKADKPKDVIGEASMLDSYLKYLDNATSGTPPTLVFHNNNGFDEKFISGRLAYHKLPNVEYEGRSSWYDMKRDGQPDATLTFEQQEYMRNLLFDTMRNMVDNHLPNFKFFDTDLLLKKFDELNRKVTGLSEVARANINPSGVPVKHKPNFLRSPFTHKASKGMLQAQAAKTVKESVERNFNIPGSENRELLEKQEDLVNRLGDIRTVASQWVSSITGIRDVANSKFSVDKFIDETLENAFSDMDRLINENPDVFTKDYIVAFNDLKTQVYAYRIAELSEGSTKKLVSDAIGEFVHNNFTLAYKTVNDANDTVRYRGHIGNPLGRPVKSMVQLPNGRYIEHMPDDVKTSLNKTRVHLGYEVEKAFGNITDIDSALGQLSDIVSSNAKGGSTVNLNSYMRDIEDTKYEALDYLVNYAHIYTALTGHQFIETVDGITISSEGLVDLLKNEYNIKEVEDDILDELFDLELDDVDFIEEYRDMMQQFVDATEAEGAIKSAFYKMKNSKDASFLDNTYLYYSVGDGDNLLSVVSKKIPYTTTTPRDFYDSCSDLFSQKHFDHLNYISKTAGTNIGRLMPYTITSKLMSMMSRGEHLMKQAVYKAGTPDGAKVLEDIEEWRKEYISLSSKYGNVVSILKSEADNSSDLALWDLGQEFVHAYPTSPEVVYFPNPSKVYTKDVVNYYTAPVVYDTNYIERPMYEPPVEKTVDDQFGALRNYKNSTVQELIRFFDGGGYSEMRSAFKKGLDETESAYEHIKAFIKHEPNKDVEDYNNLLVLSNRANPDANNPRNGFDKLFDAKVARKYFRWSSKDRISQPAFISMFETAKYVDNLTTYRLKTTHPLIGYEQDFINLIKCAQEDAAKLSSFDKYAYLSHLEIPTSIDELYALARKVYQDVYSYKLENIEKMTTGFKKEYEDVIKYNPIVSLYAGEARLEQVVSSLSPKGHELLRGSFDDVLFNSSKPVEPLDHYADAVTYHKAVDKSIKRRDSMSRMNHEMEQLCENPREYRRFDLYDKYIKLRKRLYSNVSNTPYYNTLQEHLSKFVDKFYELNSIQILSNVVKSEDDLLAHLLHNNGFLIVSTKGSDDYVKFVKELESKCREWTSNGKVFYEVKENYIYVGVSKNVIVEKAPGTKNIYRIQGIKKDYYEPKYDSITNTLRDYLHSNAELMLSKEYLDDVLDIMKDLDFISARTTRGSFGSINTAGRVKHIYKNLPDVFKANTLSDDMLTNDMFFKNDHYDRSIIGGLDNRFKATDDVVTDPLELLEQPINHLSGQRQAMNVYIHSFFRQDSQMRFDNLFRDLSDEDILDALAKEGGMVVVSLKQAKTYSGFAVKQHNVRDALSLEVARNSGAIVVPYEVYTDMVQNLNLSTVSNKFLKFWAKAMIVMKVGHLSNPGTWIRNWLDATIKMTGDTGSAGETARYQILALDYLRKYKRAQRFVMDEDVISRLGTNGIEKEWASIRAAAGVDLTYSEYCFLDNWMKSGISGGESSKTKQYKRMVALADNKNLGLKPGRTDNMFDARQARKNYNLVQEDIVRWESLGDAEVNNAFDSLRYSDYKSFKMDKDRYIEIYNGAKCTGEERIVYNELTKALIKARSKRFLSPAARLSRTSSKVFDTCLSPMSMVEELVRLAEMLALTDKGYTRSEILKTITESQFNYDLKSGRAKEAELVMLYYTFEKNNLIYWINRVNKNPRMLRYLEHFWGTLGWDAAFEYADTDKDPFNNKSLQYVVTHGGIPIGDRGLYLKTNPSFLSALNWLTGTPEAFLNSISAPAELLVGDVLDFAGVEWRHLFSEFDTDYQDITTFTKILEATPIVGTIYDRYFSPWFVRKTWQRLLDYSKAGLTPDDPLYLVVLKALTSGDKDTGVPQALIHTFAPTLFGAVKLNAKAETFDAFQAALEKQGKWYDYSLGKVVPLSEKNTGLLNDSSLTWEMRKLLMLSLKGKIWDSNAVGKDGKPGAFVNAWDYEFGDLNLTYKEDFGWEKLKELKYEKFGQVWDANQHAWVDEDDYIPGKLNDKNLTWEKYCYYMGTERGLYWDNNQQAFVDKKHYIPGGLNPAVLGGDPPNLSFSELCALKLALHGETWSQSQHKFIKTTEPMVKFDYAQEFKSSTVLERKDGTFKTNGEQALELLGALVYAAEGSGDKKYIGARGNTLSTYDLAHNASVFQNILNQYSKMFDQTKNYKSGWYDGYHTNARSIVPKKPKYVKHNYAPKTYTKFAKGTNNGVVKSTDTFYQYLYEYDFNGGYNYRYSYRPQYNPLTQPEYARWLRYRTDMQTGRLENRRDYHLKYYHSASKLTAQQHRDRIKYPWQFR